MENMRNTKALAAYGTEFIFDRFELDWFDVYEGYSDSQRLEWLKEMFGAMGVFLTVPLIDENMLSLFLRTFEKSLL